MEWELDVVQPPHLRAFDPLLAQEVGDLLYTVPPKLSQPIASFLLLYLEDMTIAWEWFYNRSENLQQYFLSLCNVAAEYSHPSPTSDEPSPFNNTDESFVSFLTLELSVRVDESSEAIIWDCTCHVGKFC